MENFTINGQEGFITISIEETFGFPNNTFHFGGYDTKSTIEIHVGNYKIKG